MGLKHDFKFLVGKMEWKVMTLMGTWITEVQGFLKKIKNSYLNMLNLSCLWEFKKEGEFHLLHLQVKAMEINGEKT